MLIIYKYVKNEEILDIARETGAHPKTLGRLFGFIGEIIATSMSYNEMRIGGYAERGLCKIVEIDGSVFFKRKYHRGRISGQQRVFVELKVVQGSTSLFRSRTETRAQW